MSRPKGLPKTGGRAKGVKNAKIREVAERAAKEGITPLEVMINTMRWHWDADRRVEAALVAKDAAPYMHPRLAAMTVGGDPDNPLLVRNLSDEALHAKAAVLLAKLRR